MNAGPEKPESVTSQIPAPSSNNHAEPPPGKPPKELKSWQVWFTILSLPVFFSLFLCALLGLFVLTGGLCGCKDSAVIQICLLTCT